jgi:LuxR family maltose regulon positive regulatory protein
VTTADPDEQRQSAVQAAPPGKAEPLAAPGYTLRPLESRLRPPRPSLALVRRDTLLASLAASAAPLTLVSAPAGAGKTSLLLQWFDESELPKAWLTLDDDGNDPIVLLTYLALALARVAKIGPTVLEWLRLPAPPIREAILPTLAAALAAAPAFLLVLDDGQRLRSAACWQLLTVLFEALPAGASVAIATRRDPEIPLARLRAAGRLAELRFADLTLDRDEATQLLAMNGRQAEEQVVEALLEATEGWAAGLYLAALSGSATGLAPSAEVHGDRREVGQYLTSEVLALQPPELRRFLLETSILERLCPELCRTVTGRRDSDELLRRLAGENLFVWALGENEWWYRYHHLFAEYLQAELARRSRADIERLHASAAGWFEAAGDVEAAVKHWLAAGEVARAAAVVGRIALEYLFRSGQVETVRRWLELFGDEQIQGDVPLTLVAGMVYSMSGDPRLGRLWINTAVSEQVDDRPHSGRRHDAARLAGLAASHHGRRRPSAHARGHRVGSLAACCH